MREELQHTWALKSLSSYRHLPTLSSYRHLPTYHLKRHMAASCMTASCMAASCMVASCMADGREGSGQLRNQGPEAPRFWAAPEPETGGAEVLGSSGTRDDQVTCSGHFLVTPIKGDWRMLVCALMRLCSMHLLPVDTEFPPQWIAWDI